MAQEATRDSMPRQQAAAERQAVIDIGSNSVRLVIYDGPKRAPTQICNQKVLCGLGRDMVDGKLNPDAVRDALATLNRFHRLLEEHRTPPARVIATSAVREAKDGPAFVKAVRDIGFDIAVVDGMEEAELAALGVIACEPSASGIVGDLGGGSLELATINEGGVGKSVSLLIGPLRLIQQSSNKTSAAGVIVNKALDSVAWLTQGKGKTLYAVGGAWRAIGKILMDRRAHPLEVLHHFEFSRSDALTIADTIAKQSARALQAPGISRRRLDTLPFAALVLKSVIERTRIDNVMISAGGIREGLLYRELTPKERAADPLLEGARFHAEKTSPEPTFGDAVIALTDALFEGETPSARRVREATCILIDIGAYSQPDPRGMQAFDMAVSAQLYGVSHPERIAIALSLYCRHEGAGLPASHANMIAILDESERQRALRLGLAMRFASDFAPKAPRGLAGCTLSLAHGKIQFKAPKEKQPLMGELARKRLSALAAAYETDAIEVYY
jgi:exopolyphosphatase/guanosine-5'-triphosphate,3'-diphosphate pyrophosphatase